MEHCTLERLPDGRWRCPACNFETKRPYVEAPRRVCRSKAPRVLRVGDHLAAIFTSLGISGKCRSGCPEWMDKMNAWGPEGCREHREEILAHLQTAYDQSSLQVKVIAFVNSAWNWGPLTLDGLLDEAIRRAEATEKSRPAP